MGDAASVAVFDAFDDLEEDAASFALVEAFSGLGFDVAVQGATADVFHDEEDIFRRINCLKHLHNIRIPYLLHQLNLPPHTLLPININQLILLIHLHRNLLPRHLMQPNPHNRIRPLPYRLPYYILIHTRLRAIIRVQFLHLSLLIIDLWKLKHLFFYFRNLNRLSFHVGVLGFWGVC